MSIVIYSKTFIIIFSKGRWSFRDHYLAAFTVSRSIDKNTVMKFHIVTWLHTHAFVNIIHMWTDFILGLILICLLQHARGLTDRPTRHRLTKSVLYECLPYSKETCINMHSPSAMCVLQAHMRNRKLSYDLRAWAEQNLQFYRLLISISTTIKLHKSMSIWDPKVFSFLFERRIWESDIPKDFKWHITDQCIRQLVAKL